jgi:hypothetical protein
VRNRDFMGVYSKGPNPIDDTVREVPAGGDAIGNW